MNERTALRPSTRVLVAGVYLADRENNALAIVGELSQSRRWIVEQRWIALGSGAIPDALAGATAWRAQGPEPKFTLLNRLFQEIGLDQYAYVLVCDDDIRLPADFVDRYLEFVVTHDLALAQPARSHGSYIDHFFVEQLDGLVARRTRFVEIGPLFSMRRDVVRLLTPFSDVSPMGWGYDFVWPILVEETGLRMGIVDATPIAHDLRKPVANYDHGRARESMEAYLSQHRHLTRQQAFSIVEAYS